MSDPMVTWRVVLKCSHVKLSKRDFDYELPDEEQCLVCNEMVEVHAFDLFGMVA